MENLKAHIEQHPPSYGDAGFVPAMLYECHNENNSYDNEQICAEFETLYQRMNGMPLQEVDRVIYPVCTLCRDRVLLKKEKICVLRTIILELLLKKININGRIYDVIGRDVRL